MDTPIHSDLLREIADFCAKRGLSESRFGEVMMNDPRLVFDLRRGRELRRRTEASLRAKMAAPAQDGDAA